MQSQMFVFIGFYEGDSAESFISLQKGLIL